MNKLDELIEIRKKEIEREDERIRKDKENLNTAKWLGVWGAVVGVVGGFILYVCIAVVLSIIGGIYAFVTEETWVKDSNFWLKLLLWSCMIIGGIIGYIVNFSDKRGIGK
jgi:hypothetical protein